MSTFQRLPNETWSDMVKRYRDHVALSCAPDTASGIVDLEIRSGKGPLMDAKRVMDIERKRDEATRQRAFILALEKLTREHSVIISGCGCCGSPSVDVDMGDEFQTKHPEAGYTYTSQLQWVIPSEFDRPEHRPTLVRDEA